MHTPPADARPPIPLSTQELRLAAVLTGGVSLAVWMGGVAREINLLIRASDRRLAGTEPAPDPLQERYRQLLDCVDVAVSIDVLSGTSAGGINAALLGLVNATGHDLGVLRDIWLEAGAFDKLLRDPSEASPPSVLKGDGQLLSALRTGIGQLQGTPATGLPNRTDVFITTTLLSPEVSRFTDDYGTVVTDADHHGLFHFDETDLRGRDILSPLALAARSSASFPAAFEPAYLAYDDSPDATHPDMAGYANTSRAHWAADGGLLANRPIGPLLQTVFDRPASREVRRTLLYIVPSSSPGAAGPDALITAPLGIGEALRRDLGAALNQSIAADLAAITEHNERVAAIADTRLRLAGLGARLIAAGASSAGPVLCDPAAWSDYRRRQGQWLVQPVIDELTRQLGNLGNLAIVPLAWRAELGELTGAPGQVGPISHRLAGLAEATITAGWPDSTPAADQAAAVGARLGRSALDSAKAAVLDLLRAGYALADLGPVRQQLAGLASDLHTAMPVADRTDLRDAVRQALASPDNQQRPLAALAPALCQAQLTEQAAPDELAAAWAACADVINRAHPLLSALLDTTSSPAQAVPPATGASRQQRQATAGQRVATYLDYLGADAQLIVLRLLELQVAERSVLPAGAVIEQPVELIQVSADTRTLLASNRSTAEAKLTGMQLHHFGAFYKSSWRANDWLWGRMDGCGWLVHILLDPRRLRAVMENNLVASGSRAATLLDQLQAIVGQPLPPTQRQELAGGLAFLDDDRLPIPASLPDLSMWVAAAMQEFIAAEELACVASYLVPASTDGELTGRQRLWLANYQQAAAVTDPATRRAGVAALLASCPVADERLTDQSELQSPLFLRTITQTTAVLTAVVSSMQQLPATVRPTLMAARTIARTAYVGMDTTHGKRRTTVLVGLALMALGLLAMINHAIWLGLPGLILFGAGTVLVAVTVLRRVTAALSAIAAVALLLAALASWIPWLNRRLFSWLGRSVLPWMQHQRWPWTVLLLLVLIPPGVTIADRLRRR